ncbi:unnamed protein product [Phytomonas sp. EM1]|nr:unnamed protein product [Phytomonas sp. EM1]|eukprot:CCW60245.1 unnamed protein product [Phytomonas sp. isolate EM1]
MSESEQASEIRRLLDSQVKKSDPFAILKLDIETCEASDVNKAYRRIALHLHPDKCKLPYAAEAFHVAEKAHKLLSQEVVLNHLKRAHMRRKEVHSESTSSSVPNGSTQQKSSSAPLSSTSKFQFGTLSKLSSSGLSTDEQKSAEIDRLLRCKSNDYFVIMDLDPAQCEVADVDKRYRRMAQALHPDKCQLPHVSDVFKLFEKAHKELSDDKKLRRFKMSFLQQQKREAALREEMLQRAGQNRQEQQPQSGSSSGLTAEERLELRRQEALREQQMEAMRLGDEASRKRKRMEEKETEMRELAAELERQRKEWRDLQIF